MSYDDKRKEEILAKSRNARKDEGAEHAYDKGHRLSYELVYFTSVAISLYAIWIDNMALMFSQGVVIMMGPLGICIARYRFNRSKWAIALGILFASFAAYAGYQVVYLTLGR